MIFVSESSKTSSNDNKEYSRAVDCGSGHLFCWLAYSGLWRGLGIVGGGGKGCCGGGRVLWGW